MPRGNPKKFSGFRLDPVLLAAVQERTDNVTAAVEEGLRLWLTYERRKAAKVEALAKHLAPPPREIAPGRRTMPHERPARPLRRDQGP
jgi:hypothetical protein